MMYEKGHRNWDQTLQSAVDIMNTTKHDITRFSPQELWQGHPIMWQQARERMTEARKQMNKTLENKHVSRHYYVGQMVWAFDFVRAKRLDDKFSQYWLGPWVLLARVGRVLCKVRTHQGQTKIIHTDAIQPYIA